ncbi:DUF4202 domain-containing protein [Thalassotalea euphylliae]|uniref:DUF4202 domain-containing protein n=1 Tax=Thalassotalea euphylliae TaxID=1655234 RepID=A0A3E0TMH5_9GAMM|nr:DUF4202 domain-containing protein [Thalassotalea euphylliae]REL25771.1 DUF4202 domain-containing protein [Thalassotalea euphylliae]
MSSTLEQVIDAIDAINQQDPNVENVDGKEQPKELVYGQRMSQCLHAFWPNSSEHLQIAVRAQHVKRWAIARSEYPEGKAGYLTWRKSLGQLHAETASELMRLNGYNQADAERTASIIRKEKLKSNPESQILEDVACLVFLSYYFAPFAAKHSDEKIISILQKTWRKMSETAQQIALKAELPEHLAVLVKHALAEL